MPSVYEELETKLESGGPAAMLDLMCSELRRQRDYHGLFYGMLLQRRLALGLPAVQVGKSEDVPKELQPPYEDAIRESARTVGQLYLDEGDIASAWPFFRMIGEPAAVATALDQAKPSADDGEQVQRLIEVALHEGVNPKRGFALVLERYGTCNAITMFSSGVVQQPAARMDCLKLLVRNLYEELRERLKADVEGRGLTATSPLAASHSHSPQEQREPPGLGDVRALLAVIPPFTEEEFYHIDISHLSSVVQFCLDLPECDELKLAVELCEYGMRLAPKFQNPGDPPFENLYADHRVFFRIILGEGVEEGLAHFRAKAEGVDGEESTLPAEVYVNLLVHVKLYSEAVAAYSRYLARADVRQLHCPSLQELCQEIGDFRPLVEVSLRRGDLVNYAAGLVQGRMNV
jgi:hypothetical protein